MFHDLLNLKYGEYQNFLRRIAAKELRNKGITDEKVLAAIEKVKRHLFAPDYLRTRSCEDLPLPIAENRTMPGIFQAALTIQNLNLKGSEKVLELGSGCGYQTALLAELSGEVYAVEDLQCLFDNAKAVLEKEGYKNIELIHGTPLDGCPRKAPFDIILINSPKSEPPPGLIKQLATTGRIVFSV